MVISVNQLSLYGAVSEKSEELPVGQRAVGKPKAQGQLDKVEILTQPSRFVTAGRDLDTTLSSSFWSCILFTIVEQLIKLKF